MSKEETPTSQNTGQNSSQGQFRVVRHEHGHHAQTSPLREERLKPANLNGEVIRAGHAHEGILIQPVYEGLDYYIPVHDIVLQP